MYLSIGELNERTSNFLDMTIEQYLENYSRDSYIESFVSGNLKFYMFIRQKDIRMRSVK